MDFKIKSKDAIVNIIFNQGKNKKQTEDLKAINSTKYYEITLNRVMANTPARMLPPSGHQQASQELQP